MNNCCLTTHTHTHIYIYQSIGIMVRVFANDQEDQGSIPHQVIPKTHKMILDASLLNTQYYKVLIKGKGLGRGVTPVPIPRCSS